MKNFWAIGFLTLLVSPPTHATNWDGLIKKLFGKSKTLNLVAGRETKPALKMSPRVLSFKGALEIPAHLQLIHGHGTAGSSAQLVFDNQVVCNYQAKSNHHSHNKVYYFKDCSDYSRAKDNIEVANKVELKLNSCASDRATIEAKIKILRSDEVEYGIVFPYIKASQGQILIFNGEAWVPSNPSDLDLQGLEGEQGLPGPQGLPGAAGLPGSQGLQGEKGDKGDKGDAGAIGAKGENGVAGAAGAVGAVGPQGLKGDNGLAGAAGAVGAVGPQGPKGENGLAGAAGAVGAVGPQGPKGDNGLAGAAGAVGAVGPQGPKGDNGLAGAAGATGAIGAQGLKGDNGLAGAAGATGAVGAQGPKGDDGSAGAAGPQGAAGLQGPKGDRGLQGVTGATGPTGPQGLTGAQGLQGDSGSAGATGAVGAKGDKGDRGLSEIAYLRDQNASGVQGGSCVAGVWQTRNLNTLGGDNSFVSLATNRFTLTPGKYFVEVHAPAYSVGQHQAKLRTVGPDIDVLYGSTSVSHLTAPSLSVSIISGEIIVSETSTFDVQHRCASSKTNFGFGIAASFGTPEIYTQVKIIKKQ
ncbi:MAG TPA: hypothetical protein VNJ01_06530 [Bacteriovoracaceae bacterium]|nr:hypothetical protein [Bacteriovoracaceae bacterium]